jgi:fatty acid desaturase
MARDFLPATDLVARSTYVRALRPELPAGAFDPATSRLLLIPIYASVAILAIVAVALHWLPWFLVPVLSLVIGVAFSCLTFIAHEAVHGGIVRNRTARHLIGGLGFLPFAVSPRLWAAWHDRVHHANANLENDPDMYPTLAEYKGSARIRFFVNTFSLGARRVRGALSLILGFTVQSVNQLVSARRVGFLDAKGFRRALTETVLGVAFWTVVAVLVGFPEFLFVFVVPHLIANAMVMSFILTNHSLSPRVEIDDPLASGVSVTGPKWFERLTLMFGYHVEHHLFPAMSSRHAPLVRDLLREKWPERYQSMPHLEALRALHRTARLYKDAVTLVDPKHGDEYPTVMPRAAAS